MKSYKLTGLLVTLAVGATAGAIALAAPEKKSEKKETKGVAVGEKAPEWEGLMGVDDKSHSMSDLKDAKVIVQVFTCNGCPVAKAYEERFVEFQKDYEDKGVQLVAINVNNSESENLAAMKKRAKEQKFNFAYLDDPSQESPKNYGAEATPHVFVIDNNRKVAFIGAFDDNMNPDKVEKQFVRDAVDALLAGQTVEVTKTKAHGCKIKWERK